MMRLVGRTGLSVALIFLSIAAGAAPAHEDPWTDEAGVERAKAVLSQCLEHAQSTPPTDAQPCINAAFLRCESEHGTMSQRDLNDCASFSYRAWDSRRAAVLAQLLGAKTIDPKFGRAEPMIERLRESERRWDNWNKADCELQAALSEGGTMHSMEIGICLSHHAAHRAQELESLSFWWAKLFTLPE